MRFAIISDIHSNSTALETVLADASQQGITPGLVWCPGDVIGYGPAPCESLARLAEWIQPGAWVIGNHDAAIVGRRPDWTIGAPDTPSPLTATWWRDCGLRYAMNPPGVNAAQINRELLLGQRQGWPPFKNGAPHFLALLNTLPRVVRLSEELLLTHGGLSENQPTFTYVFSLIGDSEPTTSFGELEFSWLDRWSQNPTVIQLYGAMPPPIVVMGHTHQPAFFVKQGHAPAQLEPIVWNHPQPLKRGTRRIILNPGSVGHPRDHHPAAAYLILDLDEDQVEFRRVPYAIGTVQARMEDLGLSTKLIGRLAEGR